MLNNDQFPEHEWIDVQPEGLYLGRTPLRHARVYTHDPLAEAPLAGKHNLNKVESLSGAAHDIAEVGEGVRLQLYRAEIPTESGWHAAVEWSQVSDRRAQRASVKLSLPEGMPAAERAAFYKANPKRQTRVESPEEAFDAISKLTSRKGPKKPAQRTHFESDAVDYDNWRRLR